MLGFASEAKALIGLPGCAEVRPFPPGHYDAGDGAADEAYWDGGWAGRPHPDAGVDSAYWRHPRAGQPPVPPPQRASWCQAAEEVRALVEAAVRKRLACSDREVGVLCSGIWALVACVAVSRLAAQDRASVRAFTVEYSNGMSEDAMYARMLCAALGLSHTVVRFGPEDVEQALPAVVRICESHDPNTVRAAVPMFLLARHIAANTDVRVLLSGEGADELFMGYGYFGMAPDPASAERESARLVRQLHQFDLLRADRCFGACGLEVRVPFLDRDLLRYAQGLPGGLRMFGGSGGTEEKALLRAAFRHAGGVYDALTRTRVVDRPKERLSDGCGFSYVPDLLNALVRAAGPSTGGDLAAKLRAEQAAYHAAFDAHFGAAHRGLVVPRTMPPWGARGVAS